MTPTRAILEDLESNLPNLDIDAIKEKLSPLTIGYALVCPTFEPGAFLYRARKITSEFNKEKGIVRADLIYPPKESTKLGRLNRHGDPVFYSSMHKESVFFELQNLKAGDELLLTFWKTTAKMIANNIGYTDFVFERLGAKRSVPRWGPTPEIGSNKETLNLTQLPPEVVKVALSKDERHELREAFGEYFMRSVPETETYRYKLTAAIGELHLGTITDTTPAANKSQFAGILYPSTKMYANGDNLALLPWFVDAHLEFRKAVHVRVDSRTDTEFKISNIDTAKEFDSEGKLKWLGKVPTWPLPPGHTAKMTLTEGLDPDGDYLTDVEGKPCHWVVFDQTVEKEIEPQ